VRGGVTYREAHLAMEMIADTESMASLEVVEINPILDEHNRTAAARSGAGALRAGAENPLAPILLAIGVKSAQHRRRHFGAFLHL